MIAALACGCLAVLCWPLRHPRPDISSSTASLRQAAVHRLHRGRAQDPVSAVFATLVQGIAPAVEAGVPPPVAVATAAAVAARTVEIPDLAAELAGLSAVARTGSPLAATWAGLASRHPDAGLEPVARAWSLSDRIGCGLSDALSTAVASMREQEDHRRRVAAATAGPRATMQLLTLLPVAGVGISAFIGVDPVRLYTGTPGLISLVFGLVLLWAGRRMIRSMIARSCAPGPLR
ncbi:type II secretion system F family protein [Allobranchiibius sp. CTAmp26]|uniref:type II secretion system F family protein n=1 Tax=Allobranchiibius sp. CTAmp26 TaxID=2815214 RepID=UPI001AA13942|nr:type II secretion system F family protein [Allobranchiibius sp. CTAmp26]MBO1753745.1 type II secretion system F family protein [Allobranchiibius sp. CTAmp26]